MATLNGGAEGHNGHSGSARGRLRYKGVAEGHNGYSGSARGLVVAGVHITQLGAQIDVGAAVDVLVTQAAPQIDVERIVPVHATTLGAIFDVDRIVPTQATTAGIGLDVDRIVPAQLSTVGATIDARYRRTRTLTMCWEFHVYTRGGTYLAYLDNAFDKSYLTQLWDVGGGSFRLPTDDDKATTTNLKVGNIVKVRYANVDIGAWVMETIATTYVDTGEGAARIITVSGRGLLGSLQKGLVYPSDLGDATTVERVFTNATKAEIFLTFYNEFVLRGGGLFTTSFTDTNDSDSVAWADSVSLKFKAGQTILDVLRQLQGFGLEVIARPDKTLDAYTSAGSDLSADVAFRYGQNVLSCSVQVQGADVANVVLGEAQGLLDEDTNASSISDYGRLEAYLPVRNTSAAGDIAAANSVFLTEYAQPPNSIALSVATFPDYPLLDYNIGDTVHVSIPDEIDADYRILAIAMQEGSGPCDLRVSVELNSLQAEYLARLQRAMDASLASIQPGQGAASGLAQSSTSYGSTNPVSSIGDLDDVVLTSVTDNEVLAYDSGSGNWINQTADEAALVSGTILTTKGDLLTRNSSALARLGVGTDGYYLKADSSAATGLAWGSVTAGTAGGGSMATDPLWAAAGDVAYATGNDAGTVLPIGTVGQVLTVSSGTIPAWETPASGGNVATDAIWAAAGDVLYATGNDAGTILGIGTIGQVLTVSSGTIPAWETPASGSGMATDPLWNASGDIAYATADDAGTVLPIGTVGYVLTVGAGTVPTWAAASSGSLGYWLPDAAPASAGAYDDEFNDLSVSVAWTEYDQPAKLTVSEVAQGLSLSQATNAGDNVTGVFKAAPDADWTIWTKVTLFGPAANYAQGGLLLGQDLTNNPATSDVYTFGLIFSTAGDERIQAARWSQYNTFSTSLASITDVTISTSLYLRIIRSSTTYYFDRSSDGIGWHRFYSGSLAFTPAEFGLFSNNVNSGATTRAVFRFFRYIASAADLTDIMNGNTI